MKPAGLILYEGKSSFNQDNIVVIATGFKKSANKKTGNIIQTWVLLKDIHPWEAIQNGKDEAVCTSCPHRLKHGKYKDCYVQPVTGGPSQIWKSYKKGNYGYFDKEKHLDLFTNKVIRFSAYGESVITPLKIYLPIINVAKTCLCYTHYWKHCDQNWKNYAMASVDSEKEYFEARKLGWRTFRVRRPTDPILENEFICPASSEKGFKLTCEQCKSCRGLHGFNRTAKSRNKIGSPVIIVHGVKKKNFINYTISAKTKKNLTQAIQ